MLSSSHGNMNSKLVDQFAIAFEPLFLKHGVDLVLTGHVHKYERSEPMKSLYPERAIGAPGHPIYVVLGMAGHTFQMPWSQYSSNHFFQPAWSVFRTANWGYCMIETTADTLTFQYRGDQSDGVHDEIVLSRSVQAAHRARLAAGHGRD